MLRGLATVGYVADDVRAAARWYADLLGIEPYFVRPDTENPAYVEFRVGDYEHELGILDRRYAPASLDRPVPRRAGPRSPDRPRLTGTGSVTKRRVWPRKF